MSDVYIFADSLNFGLTPCAPIVNFPESDFVAALCLDLNASGSLSHYYPFDKVDQPTYMIFNQRDDQESGEIDLDKDVQESQFLKFLTKIMREKMKDDELKFDRFEIKKMSIESETARLYANEIVEWATVSFIGYPP